MQRGQRRQQQGEVEWWAEQALKLRVSVEHPVAIRVAPRVAEVRSWLRSNVEFTTDLNSLVIMGADLINAGSDAGQMEPMVEQIEAEQGPLPEDA